MSRQVRAYVLAGGRSRRFPGDKALAPILGQPQIVRLRQQLIDAGHDVEFVADSTDRYINIGISCIEDLSPGYGPFGGLLTALTAHEQLYGEGWILLVSCDQVLWRREWSVTAHELDRLAASLRINGVAMIDSFMKPQESSGQEALGLIWWAERFSPIPGYFHTKSLAQLEPMWEVGDRAMKCIQAIGIGYLPSLLSHPASYSFNTPEQLNELLQRLDPPKS